VDGFLFQLPSILRASLALEEDLSRVLKLSGYFTKNISQQQHTKNIKWLNTMYLFIKCVILLRKLLKWYMWKMQLEGPKANLF
jgi:hypothetical protein